MNKPLSLVTGLLLLANICIAQTPVTTTPAANTPPAQPPVKVDNSLSGLYNAVLKKTFYYQQDPIGAFHKAYMDTLNLERKKLREANVKLAEQTKTIGDLQSSVSTKDQSLSQTQSKVNSISFVGIALSKATYNVMMWGLVLVLGGSLAAVIFLSASSRKEAIYRTQLHDELSTEFAAYKVKANEKEKKLARELQTERNKVDELMGR
jgi:hypothetical protein